MLQLEGKTYIITGSNKGIGKVIAERFARAGASVTICGRDLERLEAVRQEFLGKGYSVLSVQAELTRPEECERLVRSTVDHFGKIDGLINNAGLPMRGRFEKMSAGLFAEVVKVYKKRIG